MLHGRVVRPPSPARRCSTSTRPRRRAAGRRRRGARRHFPRRAGRARRGRAAEAALRGSPRRALGASGRRCPTRATCRAWLAAQPAETSGRRARARTAPRPDRAHAARELLAALHRAWLDRRRRARWRSAQDGGLQVWTHSQGIYDLRARSRAGAGHAGGADRGPHVRGRRLLRAQRRRRRGVRRGTARARRAGPAGARAVDARGRTRLGAVRPGDGGRDRGGSRRRRHRRRLAARDLEQRPHRRARARRRRRRCSAAGISPQPFERQPAINPPLAGGGGASATRCPPTTFRAWQVVNHLRARRCRCAPPRCARSARYANVFAIESFMDELAAAAGATRSRSGCAHLRDPRARAVIETAADDGRMDRRRPARRRRPRHRLRALQEHRRLLRGRRGSRGGEPRSACAGS